MSTVQKMHMKKVACLAICVSLVACLVHAGFRPLFRPDEYYKPSNNLRECRSSVRQSIKEAKRAWGDFQFSCVNSVVQRIYVSTSSKVGSSVSQFITQNGALFGIEKDSPTITMNGDNGHIFLKGAKTAEGYISRILWEEKPRSGSGPGGTIATRDLLRAPGVIGPPDVKKPLVIIEVWFPPVPSESKPK